MSGARRAKLRRDGQTPRSRVEDQLQVAAAAWGCGSLRGLAIMATILDDVIAREVAAAREVQEDGAPGQTWASIGADLGISKQAAQQRYGVKGA